MLKIWGRTNSIDVQKVLWCCAELNLQYLSASWQTPDASLQIPDLRSDVVDHAFKK